MRRLLPLLILSACEESPIGGFAGEVRTRPQVYGDYVGDLGGFQLLLHKASQFTLEGRLDNRLSEARCGIEVLIELEFGEARLAEIDRLESGASAPLVFESLNIGGSWEAAIRSSECVDPGPSRAPMSVRPWSSWTEVPGTVELRDGQVSLETSSSYDHFRAELRNEGEAYIHAEVALQISDGVTEVQLGPSLPTEISSRGGRRVVVFESDRLDPERFQAAVSAL